MKNSRAILKWLLLLAVSLIISLAGCVVPPTGTPTPSPTATYSEYQLEYKLLSAYPDYFWCDPDYYPVAREGQEQQNALDQFQAIKANAAEFQAIREHLNLPDKADYTNEEKFEIYRQHKRLTRIIQMTAAGNIYNFVLRIGENQGYRIEGTITLSGTLKETKRGTSFNTCPICLTKGTLIDTPQGQIAVERLRSGMTVWTVDESGKPVSVPVIETVMTAVPPSFQVVKITLSDERSVTASPGHPSADGKALSEYQVGDTLDGAVVLTVERISCEGGATYDILPSGATGFYWANGVLLRSTLSKITNPACKF
jgi:hypothetical protein